MAAVQGSEPKNRRVEFFYRYDQAEEWCKENTSRGEGFVIYGMDQMALVETQVTVTRFAVPPPQH
jgi:hypothetical protein